MASPGGRGFVLVRLSTVVVCVLMLNAAVPVWADGGAFEFDPITDTITSATFSADFAALVAHRTVGATEMNSLQLVDLSTGLPDLDLSDEMFGTAVWPDTPQVDMGLLETGWISADIDASFFPALAAGSIGLIATFTDTDDAMFAIDCLSLTIETDGDPVESFYGWPIGNENNGFGVGLADGGDLPDVLPDSIPVGATGTGFDETISSKSIYIPEPGTASLLALAGFVALRRRGGAR